MIILPLSSILFNFTSIAKPSKVEIYKGGNLHLDLNPHSLWKFEMDYKLPKVAYLFHL